METNEIMKKIGANSELAKTLEEALRRNADAEELAGMLSDAGIDGGVADELLAECQRRRGDEIGFDALDPDAMEMIAGGDEHLGGCKRNYYETECAATVESSSWCWSNDACVVVSVEYRVRYSENIHSSANAADVNSFL